ncbi:proteic killer suppression protein [Rhodoblastus acidophilus]|uniref:type II toxin-antitoxin system RelE/ParE family toxin n=1 Tax=Rhodoblastus acidophilus TaxID=1074 RepID=UPI002224DE39|nr:type II toxin-antitoxin system RelE/ParE family toxin [Rhodoblastus acidophilus]MCW2283638.1 proteic killer suppression protein [Rhodoblastus acidophilus]MCW2332498.1 proteic killer suppression protein [Rhodoblastus acidophilus]
MGIKSFKSPELQHILDRKRPRSFPSDLVNITRRKLVMLAAASQLQDLRAPPANRLEALKGDRAGQHSIRVNDQFRLCFRWTDSGAEDVEFVDYH